MYIFAGINTTLRFNYQLLDVHKTMLMAVIPGRHFEVITSLNG